MATIPRTRLPDIVTAMWQAGALKQRSHAGLIQIRNTKQVGWSWMETFGLLSVRNIPDQELFAFIQNMWGRGQIHDAVHTLSPGSGIAPNGLGTGGVQVVGGAQVVGAETLLVDGYPINTPNAIVGGDVIKVATDNAVYMASASAGSNGTGQVTIPINPPLRLTPANDAAVTTTGVTFRTTIFARSRFEESRPPQYYAGLSYVLTEAL